MIATGRPLGFVTTPGPDENVQPPDGTVIATTGTETGTVGGMATAMTIVEATEMTTGETETTFHAVTGILTRTWKRMTRGGGEMTVNEMREWLLDVTETIVNVFVTELRAKKAGNHPATATEVGGLSLRSVMVATSGVLDATEDPVF
jgi:hypothetical protein